MNPTGIALAFIGAWIFFHAIYSDWAKNLAERIT